MSGENVKHLAKVTKKSYVSRTPKFKMNQKFKTKTKLVNPPTETEN